MRLIYNFVTKLLILVQYFRVYVMLARQDKKVLYLCSAVKYLAQKLVHIKLSCSPPIYYTIFCEQIHYWLGSLNSRVRNTNTVHMGPLQAP